VVKFEGGISIGSMDFKIELNQFSLDQFNLVLNRTGKVRVILWFGLFFRFCQFFWTTYTLWSNQFV